MLKNDLTTHLEAMQTMSGPFSGVQSLGRAFGLLELIAANHSQGLTLQDIQKASALDRTTLHRFLSFLSKNDYIEREDIAFKRWRLGIRSMSLGIRAMARPPLVQALIPTMKSLARQSGDAVFLVTRMGDFSYTLHLEKGTSTPPQYTQLVGTTRLLGLGTGSTALLANFSDDELKVHLDSHQATYSAHHFSPLKIQRSIQRTRQLGFTLSAEPSTAGAGVAFEHKGFGQAAISILSSRACMPLSRRHQMAELILRELKERPL